MEPRPQQPRQPSGQRSQSPGQPPASGPSQPQPQPTQHFQPQQAAEPHQQGYPEGYDPSTVVAPPRTDYDYSPLDLAPPGQRRRRQLIAGAIGALSVVLIGALIVFGWMLLRDETPSDSDRVAVATEVPVDNEAGGTDPNNGGTPPVTTPAPTTAAAPTQPAASDPVPTKPAGQAVATDEQSLIGLLPEAAALPPGFTPDPDTTRTQEEVVTALGGSRIAEQNLTNWGWTANVERAFNNTAPEAGATSNITISMHGFKDAASAAESLPFYSDVLAANGYYDVEAPALGENARMLQLDQEDGGVLVALYVQEGPVLYRVGGYALGGDPTQDVISVATQMLGGQ